eukprot:7431250-Pyramimonas_sp.AAC.2
MRTSKTFASARSNTPPCNPGPIGEPDTQVLEMSVANDGNVTPPTDIVQFFCPWFIQTHPGCRVQDAHESAGCPLGRQSQSPPNSEKSASCPHGLPKPVI